MSDRPTKLTFGEMRVRRPRDESKNLRTFVGRFSFDLSASLSLPSFFLGFSWALSLGISWQTFWLSYPPCSSA
jgi:hypothetical protein